MLVLTRKTQQQIQIGNNITITIVRVTGQSVRVGIEAPQEVRVLRGELSSQPPKSQPASADSTAPASRRRRQAHAAPLAARCRSRMQLSTSAASATQTVSEPAATCMEDRRRVPGASFASVIRRPQRLGPASLGSMSRMR